MTNWKEKVDKFLKSQDPAEKTRLLKQKQEEDRTLLTQLGVIQFLRDINSQFWNGAGKVIPLDFGFMLESRYGGFFVDRFRTERVWKKSYSFDREYGESSYTGWHNERVPEYRWQGDAALSRLVIVFDQLTDPQYQHHEVNIYDFAIIENFSLPYGQDKRERPAPKPPYRTDKESYYLDRMDYYQNRRYLIYRNPMYPNIDTTELTSWLDEGITSLLATRQKTEFHPQQHERKLRDEFRKL